MVLFFLKKTASLLSYEAVLMSSKTGQERLFRAGDTFVFLGISNTACSANNSVLHRSDICMQTYDVIEAFLKGNPLLGSSLVPAQSADAIHR